MKFYNWGHANKHPFATYRNMSSNETWRKRENKSVFATKKLLEKFRLNSFKDYGLLRAIKTSSDKIFFDTNTSHHHHFYCKDTEELIDINSSKIVITKLPSLPKGKKISSVNVVVNLDNK